MKNILIIKLLLFTSLVNASELDAISETGRNLTNLVKTKSSFNMKSLSNYKALKTFLKEKKCTGFKYKAYIVGQDSEMTIYLVASKGKSMIIGRHFKGTITNNSANIDTMKSSTNGCINLGPSERGVGAKVVTHLQPLPNEFHVLQSNLLEIPLYVGTKGRIFAIEGGSIREVEK